MSSYQKYNCIIQDYCSGLYGMEKLPLYDLLCKAGFPHILNEMTSEELNEIGRTYNTLIPLFNGSISR